MNLNFRRGLTSYNINNYISVFLDGSNKWWSVPGLNITLLPVLFNLWFYLSHVWADESQNIYFCPVWPPNSHTCCLLDILIGCLICTSQLNGQTKFLMTVISTYYSSRENHFPTHSNPKPRTHPWFLPFLNLLCPRHFTSVQKQVQHLSAFHILIVNSQFWVNISF